MSDALEGEVVDLVPEPKGNISEVMRVEFERPIHTLDAESPQEVVDELFSKIDYLIQFAATLKKSRDAWITNHLTESGAGRLLIGPHEYYLAHDKKVKCVDEPGALSALFVVSKGDFDKLCSDFLSSQPFKHGAARQALTEEQFNTLFQTELVTKLKDGTPAPKKLQKVDPQFLKRR